MIPADLLNLDIVSLLWIVLRTFVVYVVLIGGLRIFGKRELGQMTPFDLVVILTVSNAVQNAMIGSDASLTGAIVSVATLLFTNWLFNEFGFRSPGFRRLFWGSHAAGARWRALAGQSAPRRPGRRRPASWPHASTDSTR